MSWRNVRLIFGREISDQMRDRRTLFMVAVLPLLLYPAMGLGMLQMTQMFEEQPRTVVMLNADQLPPPKLLNEEKTQFLPEWFSDPATATRLNVFVEPQPSESETDQAVMLGQTNDDLFAAAEQVRSLTQQYDAVRQQVLEVLNTHSEEQLKSHPELSEWNEQLDQLRREMGDQLADSDIDVLVIIPEGYAEQMTAENQQIAEQQSQEPTEELRPQILKNTANDKSLLAGSWVMQAIDRWEEAILRERLKLANLSQDFVKPVNADVIDVAQNEERAANVWSKLFPALLIIMSVTGAFYPAIDLGAGEKERGTMETLLISPAKRSEIVIGKFLTVLLFSFTTAILNLISMGLTGWHMLSSAAGSSLDGLGDMALPGWGSLIWVVLLAIPLAALFSAISLALGLFAKSSKEGQYYLTPLLMVTMGLTVFCISPQVELTPYYSILPIAGPALLLKGLLLGQGQSLTGYAVPVLLMSTVYCALALWWAIEQFQREEVLFRESDRFEFKAWLRHLLRDKDPTPSFTEAAFCFILVMFLQFAMMNVMGDILLKAMGLGEQVAAQTMLKLLAVQQIVIIGCPAVFMGLLLTTNVQKTFRILWPGWKWVALAGLFALVVHPLDIEMMTRLDWFFPPIPDAAKKTLAMLSDPSIPWYALVLVFGLAPAICEELAFRGFIFSGFYDARKPWIAIGLSSVLFGVMHMIPHQVFNASLLGIVMGVFAWKSRSILPCMVFHFVNNTLAVMQGQMAIGLEDSTTLQALVYIEGSSLLYRWPVLLVCAGVLVVCMKILYDSPAPAANSEPVADAVPQSATT